MRLLLTRTLTGGMNAFEKIVRGDQLTRGIAQVPAAGAGRVGREFAQVLQPGVVAPQLVVQVQRQAQPQRVARRMDRGRVGG